MHLNATAHRLSFGQKPQWHQPTESELAGKVATAMQAQYGQDTFAHFREIERTAAKEKSQRPATGIKGHERLAMDIGKADPNINTFNQFVLLAIHSRRLLKNAVDPAQLRAQIVEYATLLSALPGGKNLFAANVNADLFRLRDGLRQAMPHET
jgi:hypothetical protein